VKCRVINEGKYSEAMHHAIDEVLLKRLNEGKMQPTLRFWYRPHTTIPIGRFQSYHDEVEHDYIEENDIEVVRRITGGGAMFSEPGNVITYSIYIPVDHVNSDIEKSYSELDEFAVKALRESGVDVDYVPLNDIEHEEGKIGGAAQTRKENAVLHHTMMSYDMDTKRMLKALRIGKEKVSDKAIKSAEKRVSRISDHTNQSRNEVIENLIQKFVDENKVDWEYGSLTKDEIKESKRIVEEKFSTEKWNKKL